MDSTQINSEQRRKNWRGGRGFSSGRGLLAAIVVLVAWDAASGLLWESAGRAGAPRPSLFVGAAYAQDFAAAGQHFASAQDAFAQGQFELAAKEFQAAYDITRDPAMLLNIGESWQRAGDGKKALAGYRAYLAAQPQAPDRAEVESRITAIEAALASPPPAAAPGAAAGSPAAGATGTASPAGAASPAGTPAPAPQPGSEAAGATGQTTPPSAAAPGQTGDAPKTATPATPPPAQAKDATKSDAASPPVTPPERPMSRLRTAGWVTVAVAIALATSGAIVGLGAQDRADELRRRTTVLIGTQPPVYDEGQAEAYTTLKSEGNAYNQAAIALLSAAGAVAVTAGVLFIVDYARRPKAETKTKGGWALGPWLVPGSQGVAARTGANATPITGGLVASGSF